LSFPSALRPAALAACTPTSQEKLRISVAPRFQTSSHPPLTSIYQPQFHNYQIIINMGVERKIITRGNGSDSPASGDKVAIHYTGWLYDAKKANKGFQGKQ
jgi:hypothetical protein